MGSVCTISRASAVPVMAPRMPPEPIGTNSRFACAMVNRRPMKVQNAVMTIVANIAGHAYSA